MRLSHHWFRPVVAGFAAVLSIGLSGPSQAQEERNVKEMLKKLQKAQASIALRLHETEAKEARKSAIDNKDGGYVYSPESDLRQQIVPGVRQCLIDRERFLGTYAVGLIRSETPSVGRRGIGGSDPSDIRFDLDKYIGNFMRESAPLPYDKRGVWIVVDVGEDEVDYQANDAWPVESTDTATLDTFILKRDFDKQTKFGKTDAPIDESICGLIARFEAQLHDPDAGAISVFYLAHRIDAVSREVDEISSQLRQQVIEPYSSSKNPPKAVERANELMSQAADLEAKLGDVADNFPDSGVSQAATRIDELNTTLEDANRLIERITKGREKIEVMRDTLRITTQRMSDRSTSILPYSETYTEKMRKARDTLQAYAVALPQLPGQDTLEARRSEARNSIDDFTLYAGRTEFRFNIIVYYAPATLLVLLIGAGGIRLYNTYSQASRTRANVEWLIEDRQHGLSDATRHLDRLLEEYRSAATPSQAPTPLASDPPADLPVDSGEEAVDFGLSLVALEEHLLEEANNALRRAGKFDAQSLSNAEERLTTETTQIIPGDEWDRAQLDHSLPTDIDVSHRRLPEWIDECVELAAVAAEQSTTPSDAGAEPTDAPTDPPEEPASPKDGDDIHW